MSWILYLKVMYFLTFPGANKVTKPKRGYISERRISQHKWRAVKNVVPSIPSISGQQTWDEATMPARWMARPLQECGEIRSDHHHDEGDENLVCFASTLGMWDMAGIWSIRGTMLVKIWCSSRADTSPAGPEYLLTTWEGGGAAPGPQGAISGPQLGSGPGPLVLQGQVAAGLI